MLTTDIVERIERVSTQAWQPSTVKSAGLVGLYENRGESPYSLAVPFHGLGISRSHSGPFVEAYCNCHVERRVAIQRHFAAQLGIDESEVSVVQCSGIRPMLAEGSAGGHAGLIGQGRYGTIGGFAVDLGDNSPLVVSNNHVLAANNLAKPGDHLFTTDALHPFGALKRFMPLLPPPVLNDIDAAVGSVWVRPIGNALRYRGYRLPEIGLPVQKVGAKTGYTTGTIVAVGATAVVPYEGLGNVNFRRSLRIQGNDGPFSMPGDSGSLVLDMWGAVVGIIFAGESNGAFSLANRVDALMNGLNISFGEPRGV